jgi:hypothetical protein
VYDVFGMAVAVDGSTIVVGAPGDDTNARDRDADYVFRAAERIDYRRKCRKTFSALTKP